jgi:TolB protein
VQEVYTGRREAVSSSEGINGAPGWSPDGRRLALVLSRDGDPEIYSLELASGALARLTRSPAIDTEPVWTPDGQSILFTSDRGGSAQIYRMPASGGPAERLTFEGNYNARPNLSPDGRQLAMVHRRGDSFRIAVLDLETRLLQVLTDGPQDETPSFAPNGAMILYGAAGTRGGELRAVSVDGRVKQQLQLQEGDVREPAWGPYNR